MAAKSAGEADHDLVVGSAGVGETFEFPACGKGGGGCEKSTADCEANPWKGGSSSRLGDCTSNVVASSLFTSLKAGESSFPDVSEDFEGRPRLGLAPS